MSDFSGGTMVSTNQFPFLTDYADLQWTACTVAPVIVAFTLPVAAMNSSKGRAATWQWSLHPELSEGHFRNTSMHISTMLPIWIDSLIRWPEKQVSEDPQILSPPSSWSCHFIKAQPTATISTLNLLQSSSSLLKNQKEEDMITLKIHSFQQTFH